MPSDGHEAAKEKAVKGTSKNGQGARIQIYILMAVRSGAPKDKIID